MAAVVLAADQPAERLREARADDRVVVRAAAACRPPRTVEDRGLRPGHLLHRHAAKRFAWNVDTVAQCVGTEQAGARIVAEDVHQRAGVNRIDVLGVKRQPGAGARSGAGRGAAVR